MQGIVGHAASLLSDASFPALKDYVLAMTGLSYYCDKDDELAHRLSLRMTTLSMSRADHYLALLRTEPAGAQELDHLIEHLTIGETHFFRHQEVFAALESLVVPDVTDRLRGTYIRVWSAACANGAEAYSIAMTLRRMQDSCGISAPAMILGTDISRRALERASRAEYSDWDLRDTPSDLRDSCFRRQQQSWVVCPEYRTSVTFQYHNLVQHPFPSLLHNLCAFDIIFCRNVLMYFDAVTIERIVQQLHACLSDGGWLVVGHAETHVETFAAFEAVNVPGAVLYRKAAHSLQRAAQPVAPTIARQAGHTTAVCTSPPPTQPCDRAARSHGRLTTRTLGRDTRGRGVSLDRVSELANGGRFDEAEEACRSLIQECPLSSAPYLYLALIVAQTQRYSLAIELIRKALYLDPDMIAAHLHLGLLYQRIGQHQAASQSFRITLDLLSNTDASIVPHSDGMSSSDVRDVVMRQMET